MSDNEEISRYVRKLRETQRTSAAETYPSMLRGFVGHLHQKGKTFDTFTVDDVDTYMRSFSNVNSANFFLASLKGYMGFRTASMSVDDPNVMRETQRNNQIRAVRARPVRQLREKISLNPAELKKLLADIEKTPKSDVLYCGTVLHFYFGARPIELGHFLRTTHVNWKDNSMLLMTAKTKALRFLAWHENISPFLRRWIAALPLSEPGKWLTRKLRKFPVEGMSVVTAKTGRRTLQTQFRVRKIDDSITDMVLGHTSGKSRMGDRYTDFEKLDEQVRDAMVNNHYMILEDII